LLGMGFFYTIYKEETMKRLLSAAQMVLVTLVGMVGVSRAGAEKTGRSDKRVPRLPGVELKL